MDKQRLCEAFCGDLDVMEVPAGVAVRTGFRLRDGDTVGFYITRHPIELKFRIEDSGLMVPMLEAAGASLESGQRAIAFARMLEEYGASYDQESMELHSAYVDEDDLPTEAMRFIALLLRMQDLELLTQQTVENTFREDVTAKMEATFGSSAQMEFRVPPAHDAQEYEADVLVRVPNAHPLAVYFATSDDRVNEAVLLWMDNRLRKGDLRVALVLEQQKPPNVSNRPLVRAMNRLDATPVFRGDEAGAMQRLARIAGVDTLQ